MKFDRTVPGGSVEAECRLEGGKAVLEWAFHLIRNTGGRDRRITIPLRDEEARDCLREEQGYIRLILTDKQNRMVLECVQKLGEEEPLRSVLLRPDLWKGIREPCLYGMEAILADGGGRLVDRIRGQLALRCLAVNARDGEMRLNNESFVPKTVRYALPETGTEAAMQRQMLEDMQWLLKLGANCVCMEDGSEEGGKPWGEACPEICRGEGRDAGSSRKQAARKAFLQLCDRYGFVVFQRGEAQPGYVWVHGAEVVLQTPTGEDIPLFRGERHSLFLPGSCRPEALFYQYRAKWTQAPFVHIVPESVRRMESGNYEVLCYSNCDRVALYSDGVLFEFKSGEGAFSFREVPARTPSVMLTAEGEGCFQSLSLHKSFTK